MKLRFYDTSPQHAHLWKQLDPRFEDIARQYAHGPEAALAREEYFRRVLPDYAGPEPLLLVWHLSETASGQYAGHYRHVLAETWQNWTQTAKERVFILFFSSGGGLDSQVLHQVADGHAFVWPERVVLGQTDSLVRFLRALERALLQRAESGASDWCVNAAEIYQQTFPLGRRDMPAEVHQAWDLLHAYWQALHHWPQGRSVMQSRIEALTAPEEIQAAFQALQLLPTPAALQAALENLHQRLWAWSEAALPRQLYPLPSPCLHPPLGFDRILFADDGPLASDSVQQLQQLGYWVEGPFSTASDARPHLPDAQVLVSDVQLGTEQEGWLLMHAAEELQRTVIAISRRPRQVPHGMLNATGVSLADFSDYLHRLIWQAARAKNICQCLAHCHEERESCP